MQKNLTVLLKVPIIGNLLLFENDLKFFLNKKGEVLIEVSKTDQKKAVDVNLSGAIIKERRLDGQSEKTVVKASHPFPNPTLRAKNEEWSYTVKYERGTEASTTQTRHWSIGGSLAPFLNVLGFGGGIGHFEATYGRNREQRLMITEAKAVEESFKRSVTVPPKSTVIARHISLVQNFKCRVENIKVSFNSKDVVKCKVKKKRMLRKGNCEEERDYELGEILKWKGQKGGTDNTGNEVQITVSADYVWKETNDEIQFETTEYIL